jgi:glutathione synthase/RimK-type ligase-like ATP-grasp enzyme
MMRKKITILYSKKSCVTAKDLKQHLKEQLPTYRVVSTKDKRIKKTPVIIRVGNLNLTPRFNPLVEFNKKENVNNAANKQTMMKLLSENNITIPKLLMSPHGKDLSGHLNNKGMCYIRGANHVVRYDNATRPGDLYLTKPVGNGKREYRVHIFNNEVIAVYRKKPNEEGVKILKSHNCKFIKVSTETSRCGDNVIDMCKRAVRVMGLDFAGVDVIVDKDGNFFILEVNSAPGLNSENIKRYGEVFIKKIRELETRRE